MFLNFETILFRLKINYWLKQKINKIRKSRKNTKPQRNQQNNDKRNQTVRNEHFQYSLYYVFLTDEYVVAVPTKEKQCV